MAFAERLFRLLGSKSGLTIASVFSTGTYVAYKDNNRYRAMEEAFAKGNILPPFTNNSSEMKYYPRSDLEDRLTNALMPKVCNQYYLVNGGVGCGKTRSIVEIVRRLMDTRGQRNLGAPVFVHVLQGKSFPDTLASAVNFFFDEHISMKFLADFMMRIDSFPKRDAHQKLSRVLDAIEVSAFKYTQKTGRPVVLVLDGVNNLTAHMPGALEKIQGKAKLWADMNIVKVIFICNDEKTIEVMQSHASNWSRAAAPIYAEDMSKEQAIAFLGEPLMLSGEKEAHSNYNIGIEEAEQIYSLVGGRVYHLIAFKRSRAMNVSFKKTSKELMNKEREKLMDVCKSASARKAIDVVESSSGQGIPLLKLISICSEKDMAALLKFDIIRIRRTSRGMTVVFESKLTENVIRKLAE